ncbi:MAG TPA: porin [Ohtaekwangia sp.]|nr:porin [Ohtaekwangia sp.]
MLIFKRLIISCLAFSLVHVTSFAQDNKTDTIPAAQQRTPWYKKINIRGYAQLRYNKLLETNPELKCEQCDKSWGGENGFFFRRIRIILYGQVHERVYFYIQPDFASSPGSGALNFGQIRDAYFDVGLDKANTFRIRIGQSKVPFGFENLQSSQNRLPLDRNDALNSAVANERDLGMFFYWAPSKIRERFSYLVSSGLKGSGDYGIVGFGLYNGQTANRNDENGDPHVVARISYPLQLGRKQIIEPGLQAFRGKSVVSAVTAGVAGKESFEYLDQRAAASIVVYPQPFGFSAEYNVGTGPEYNPTTNTIEQRNLKGGYAMASYFLDIKDQVLIPFVRYQYYNGGKKHEPDARSYHVKELEIGAEWQLFKNFEMVAMYTISERRFEDGGKPDNFQKGRLLRLQFQLNF